MKCRAGSFFFSSNHSAPFVAKMCHIQIAVVGKSSSEDILTWVVITMGRPSRSLKLLLPRLLEEPPLMEGPGPSRPVRSVRMRIGPLLNATIGGRHKTKTNQFCPFKVKQFADDWPCFKAGFLTVNLPCWNSNPRHSSTHGHHLWASGCLACLVLWLWHPLGVRAWAWAVSRPCPCGLCHGVRYGEDVVARLCGPVQRSWGSVQSQGCLCEDQGEPSSLLAHRRTGYVCTKIRKGLNTRWHGLRKCQEHRYQMLWNRGPLLHSCMW